MVLCDDVLDVPNGKRSPPDDTVACGTKVTYTCNEGFTLEGDSVLLCGARGNLQGQVPLCRGSGKLVMHFLLHPWFPVVLLIVVTIT